jgi:hypothetical protein
MAEAHNRNCTLEPVDLFPAISDWITIYEMRNERKKENEN